MNHGVTTVKSLTKEKGVILETSKGTTRKIKGVSRDTIVNSFFEWAKGTPVKEAFSYLDEEDKDFIEHGA